MTLPTETLQTPVTQLLGIQHPILLAGMDSAAGPALAAAVTNAGGFGVIGGVAHTPKMLRKKIQILKRKLNDPNAPFGVDLLLPQVGKGARKTNYDYTHGHLPELIEVIIESGAKLFVSAVGVPPKWVVDKMHEAGIPVMNMVGAPKHVPKALAAGVDLICAQGGEGGGHTGDVPTSMLIPACVDLCKNAISPLTGKRVSVVAAGGIYEGRGLAMALSFGADAVWVGTRFVASVEAGAADRHKEAVVKAGYKDGTIRTLYFTGRPCRIISDPHLTEWETTKRPLMMDLAKQGKTAIKYELDTLTKAGHSDAAHEVMMRFLPAGSVAAAITSVLPAADIVNEMVNTAVHMMRVNTARIVPVKVSKL